MLNQSILLAPFSVKVNRPAILSATQKDHSVIFYNTEFCVSLGRIPSLISLYKKSRTVWHANLKGGPAPQYDFSGQRGPVKREMSLRDSAGL